MRTHSFVQTIGLLFALSSTALGQNTPPDVSNVAAKDPDSLRIHIICVPVKRVTLALCPNHASRPSTTIS